VLGSHTVWSSFFLVPCSRPSYADDFYLRKNDTYEGSWNRWQDLMTPITSASPYMTLPGNHEVSRCFLPRRMRQ
jgi:hypothetical protein